MKAGKMKNRMVWLKQTSSKETTYGQAKETFTSYTEVYAFVEELAADEVLAQGMRQSEASLKVHLRQEDANGLSTKDRLQDSRTGDVLLIDGVNLDLGGREIVATVHVFRPAANP